MDLPAGSAKVFGLFRGPLVDQTHEKRKETMRRQFVAGAVAAGLMWLLSAGVCFAQPKIAVANPGKILTELAETKEFNAGMKSEGEAIQQQLAARNAKLKELEAQKESLKTGTPQWDEVNKQIVAQKNERDNWLQNTNMEMTRKLREQAKRIHDKIDAAIAEVAKAKGFDLVLAEQRPEFTEQQQEQMNPQQYLQYLFAGNVLYKVEAVDITQEVIAKLDAAYKSK